jgi:PmbA protein
MDLLDITRRAAALAKEKGAGDAAAGSYRARHVEVAWRDGRVENVSEATTRGLGLELFVDGRYAAVSTSDLRPDALERFVEDAVALARSPRPPPAAADPELYRGQANVDLELEDPSYSTVTAALRRAEAEAVETAARGVRGAEAILSVSTSVSDTRSESTLVHTNGFEGERQGTDFWIGAEVTVQDPDGRRPEEYAASGGRFRSAMEAPEAIGARGGAGDLASGRARESRRCSRWRSTTARRAGSWLPVRPARRGVHPAEALVPRKEDRRLGRQPLLDVRDDPHVPRGPLAPLRRRGLAAHPFPVFERGVLRTYYVDTYYGRKLGIPATTARSSNLAWSLGERTQAELLVDLGEGVLVTGFLGGNSNGTTGDFSLGVRGYRVRGGALAEPVGEMNVSGNHLELWKRLVAVGNDPYPYSSMRTPTLVFEGVQFAGT